MFLPLQLLILSADNAEEEEEEEEGGKRGADLRKSGVLKALEHMCKVEVGLGSNGIWKISKANFLLLPFQLGLKERFARWRQAARCQGMRQDALKN